MNLYVTKWALTMGIATGEFRSSGDYAYGNLPGKCLPTQVRPGKDAFETWDEALAAASAARDKKIKSLEKQIAKLRAMTWTKPEEKP